MSLLLGLAFLGRERRVSFAKTRSCLVMKWKVGPISPARSSLQHSGWTNMKSCSDSKQCRKASLPDPWNQLDLSVGSARYLTANGANDSVFPVFPSLAF